MADPQAPAPPVLHDIDEHHEVPEGRVVHGRNMHFRAPVFGELLSGGGKIHLDDVLGWGKAVSPGGHITVKKRSFNATLQAPGGVVQVTTAESCLLIGREVSVRDAVNCQIFAHTVRLGSATGCLIAGRNIEIGTARPHKAEPNMVTVVVPDLPDLAALLQPWAEEMALLQPRVTELGERIAAYKADAALAHYLAIRVKVKSGTVKLTESQAQGYQQMEERLGDTAKALEAAVAERRPLAKALADAIAQAQALRDGHTARLRDCRCKILRVDGETIVRQQLSEHEDPDLSLIDPPLIPKILFRNDASVKLLCALHEGRVDWTAVADLPHPR